MIVRAAEPADAAALAAFVLEQWDEAYAGLLDAELLAQRWAEPEEDRRARWSERIRRDRVLVVDEGGRLLGTVRVEDVGGDAGPLLSSLVVDAMVRGGGIGAALVEAAIGDRPAHLWVFDGAHRAQRFHERRGFRLDGEGRPDPYGWELRMVRR